MDKRRKELLFLAVGLVILLAALYFTFKPSTPAAQATTQSPPAAAPVATAPTQPSAEIQPSAVPIPASEGGTTPGRNPFTPVIAAQPAVTPSSAPPPMLTALRSGPLPPIQPMPLQLFSPSGAAPDPGVITPGAPAPPAEPPLRLTGVIYGDPAMAIIRKGAQRYFVRPGDPVGSRYMVQSISQRRVVLAGSQGTLSLDLTGRL